MWAVNGRLIARDVHKSKVKSAGTVFAEGGKGEVALHIEMSAALNCYAFCEIKMELSENTESLHIMESLAFWKSVESKKVGDYRRHQGIQPGLMK